MKKHSYPIWKSVKCLIPDSFKSLIRETYQDPGLMYLRFNRFVIRKRLVVVVGTAHKVGSSWLYGMLRDVGYFEPGLHQVSPQFHQTNTFLLEPQAFEQLDLLRGHKIFKSHSYPIASELADV